MDYLTLSNKFFESSLYTPNLQLHNNFGESRERSAAGLVLRVRRGACGGSSGVGGGVSGRGWGQTVRIVIHNFTILIYVSSITSENRIENRTALGENSRKICW